MADLFSARLRWLEDLRHVQYQASIICSYRATHEHSDSYALRAKSMRNGRFGCVVICVLAAISGCRAPAPNWNGTWRVNPSKSNFQGPVFAVSVSPGGDYRYDDGKTSFTFRCDGKDWPMGNNRTQTCLWTSATVLDLTRKENGIKTKTYHWELSSDRRIFTSVVTVFRHEDKQHDSNHCEIAKGGFLAVPHVRLPHEEPFSAN
jgi:hypothetical protein